MSDATSKGMRAAMRRDTSKLDEQAIRLEAMKKKKAAEKEQKKIDAAINDILLAVSRYIHGSGGDGLREDMRTEIGVVLCDFAGKQKGDGR